LVEGVDNKSSLGSAMHVPILEDRQYFWVSALLMCSPDVNPLVWSSCIHVTLRVAIMTIERTAAFLTSTRYRRYEI